MAFVAHPSSLWFVIMNTSQFYRDLKKLVAPSISNDIVLMFCNNCLLVNTQQVLAAIREMSADALTMVGDRIHEMSPETEQIAAVSKQTNHPAHPRVQLRKFNGSISGSNLHAAKWFLLLLPRLRRKMLLLL